MNIIFFTLVVFALGLVIYFLYQELSPKKQIKRLWDEIHENTASILKLEKTEAVYPSDMLQILKAKNDRRGALINALLAYNYFGNEEEKEYVEGNTYVN